MSVTVPRRAPRPPIVACETCLDRKTASRIRGGQRFSEPCPDCNGGKW